MGILSILFGRKSDKSNTSLPTRADLSEQVSSLTEVAELGQTSNHTYYEDAFGGNDEKVISSYDLPKVPEVILAIEDEAQGEKGKPEPKKPLRLLNRSDVKKKDESIWKTNYERLKDYVAFKGRIPGKDSSGQELLLYNWTVTQSRLIKAGNISKDRVELLKDVGVTDATALEAMLKKSKAA